MINIAKKQKTKNVNTTITILISVMFILLTATACKKVEPDKIDAIKDRSALPMFHATEITTIISDSGVTRYRISTPQWDNFDRAAQPYWNFPKGIHFEKFNIDLKVDANMHSLYAQKKMNEGLWEFRGKVKAMNLAGELFETEQLFWDERAKRIYTDSLIRITQTSRIITTIGFESDESMSRYTMRKIQGIFAVNENDSTSPTTTPVAK